jgi:hypothetical protein
MWEPLECVSAVLVGYVFRRPLSVAEATESGGPRELDLPTAVPGSDTLFLFRHTCVYRFRRPFNSLQTFRRAESVTWRAFPRG